MVTITCPWCQEAEAVRSADVAEPEASFTCQDCGTSVAFVAEVAVLELAA
jgi:predicted RNA-binding Zn-ribbon protein involved in translation (DUF1610 family)